MAKTTPVISRGRFARVAGLLVGLVVGAGLVAGSWLPGALDAATVRVPLRVANSALPRTTVSWPQQGQAAVAVPALAEKLWSPSEQPVPIASLTKMMTIAVALSIDPVSTTNSGPCWVVSDDDVATYLADQSTDQSSVKVVAGESLCESQLIGGMIVHSASNYAEMLVELVGLTETQFVARMNALAQSWGLTQTHYADVTGFDPASVSTAKDQVTVALHLYRNDLVAQLAASNEIDLPVAGEVHSYTPLVDVGGVIGLKSGFTDAAGGCDALVLRDRVHGTNFLAFAVVLGQRGPNDLASAGARGDALAHQALGQIVGASVRRGQPSGQIGWTGATVPLVVKATTGPLIWYSTRRDATQVWVLVHHRVLTHWRDAPGRAPSQWGSQLAITSLRGVLVVVRRGSVTVVLAPQQRVSRPPWWHGVL